MQIIENLADIQSADISAGPSADSHIGRTLARGMVAQHRMSEAGTKVDKYRAQTDTDRTLGGEEERR